ncbi:hypothetical protein BC827DRAFT_734776 [Russula dissimulans]|nr:hypothetical protein BC827DRAFT_734776 [Russula dissimulans]
MLYTERVPYEFYEGDRCATPRAGTLHYVDAVLPWRFEDPAPPPPVPPKSEMRVRPAAAVTADIIPKRVTPWLFRHVKAPESHVTRAPKKAPADIVGPQEPPAYEVVQQQEQQQKQKQERPSGERPRTGPQRHNLPKLASLPTLQTTVQGPDHSPPKPAPPAKPNKSDKRREPESGSVSHHAHSPQSSVRGTHKEDRPRPRTKSSPRPAPVPGTVVPAPQPAYTHAKSFPEPTPYRRAAGESPSLSARSKSLPRGRKKSSTTLTFEKDAPLPPLPNHPPLPSSAMSRIHAAYKVSNEFGSAVMRQELRLATPLPDIPPVPRVGQRFMSATEIESFRKSRQRANKGSAEHEARRGR